MDYTATEIQLIKVIDKFILERYGKLLRVPSTRKDTIDGDFDLATEYGGIIFQYSDYYLGVDKGFFNSILGLFDMKPRNLEKLFEKWFYHHFPNSPIISACWMG